MIETTKTKKIREKSSNRFNQSKIILSIGIGIVVLGLFFIYFNEILYPAYQNYKSNCGLLTPEENETLITLGQTEVTTSITGEVTTNVSYNKLFEEQEIEIPNYVKKHEQCHFKQVERVINGRFFYPDCEEPLTMYIWELECWHVQYLPDWIYIPLYGEYDNNLFK